jgi:hypothetical protein
MTKQEKLLKRFLSKPKNFRYDELRKLLRGFGYCEIKSGQTSGSQTVFFNKDITHIIRLHKPHPQRILKRYQLDLIEEDLEKKGILK